MFRSLKKRVKAAAQQYGSGNNSDNEITSNNSSSTDIRPTTFHNNTNTTTRAKSMDNATSSNAASAMSSSTASMFGPTSNNDDNNSINSRRMSTGTTAELYSNSSKNNHAKAPPLRDTGGGAATKRNNSMNNNNNRQRRGGGRRGVHQPEKERVMTVSELTAKVSHLASFDSCVDAADALAAASHQSHTRCNNNTQGGGGGHGGGHQVLSRRVDPKSGLPDCSVLVSPDGNLLLLPPGDDVGDDDEQDDHPAGGDEGTKNKKNALLFSELMLHAQDDYDSAVYLGNDLKHDVNDNSGNNGDRACNGFSARGWSTSATSYALRQTQNSLQALQTFCEACILTNKESAARTSLYCDEFAQSLPSALLMMTMMMNGGGGGTGDGQQQQQHPQGIVPFCEWQDLDGITNTTPTTTSSAATGGGGPAPVRRNVSSSIFGPTPRRTGPFTGPHASLGQALCALERYHEQIAQDEGERWRQASAARKAVLPSLHLATEQFHERSSRRLQALQEASKRARCMEERFALLRIEAQNKWKDVYAAEDEATRRHEALLQERSRLREQQRLDQILALEQQEAAAAAAAAATAVTSTGSGGDTVTLGATTEEIWDMVSAISESMYDGSFEPMDLPSPQALRDKAATTSSTANSNASSSDHDLDCNVQTQPDEQAATTGTEGSGSSSSSSSPTGTQENVSLSAGTGATAITGIANTTLSTALSDESSAVSSSGAAATSIIPVISREQVEEELNLPTLRALAMAADDAVEDAAGSLLNVLSNLDTTRRSARIAAETALVSAGNAQAACIKSLVELERASLEARLAHLQELENATQHIEVRADLDAYISLDKKERGGTSHLGDDDDGGIASALAVLSSHVDGGSGTGSSSLAPSRKNSEDVDHVDTNNSGDDDDNKSTTREMLHAALDKLFTKSKINALATKTTSSPKRRDATDSLQAAVDFLCKTASDDTSPAARTRRSTICYALNSKRSNHVEIASVPQFEGLCKLFAALLTSCASDDGGMSNAKMLMMLAQTFYITSSGNEDVDDDEGAGLMDDVDLSERSPVRNSRSQRVYIRNRLMEHPIWSKDDFWDEVLSQQISESLAQSGVMSNFEGSGGGFGSGGRRRRGNNGGSYRQERKSKWYDLSYEERVSAASQVHAVVFAQLGALAHSMIEFGCGLERSCAFVRRMSIRNQLPTAQRTMLLQHLIDRDGIDRRESSSAAPVTTTTKVTTNIATPAPLSVVTTVSGSRTKKEEAANS